MPSSDLEDALLFNLRVAGVPKPERQFRAVPERRWKWDLAWPAAFLLVEVDGGTWTGGRHTRGAGVEQDCEKQSTAAAQGWRTMRVTRAMIGSGKALELIETALYTVR